MIPAGEGWRESAGVCCVGELRLKRFVALKSGCCRTLARSIWGKRMARLPQLPYNPALGRLAPELRNKSTLAEVLIWQRVSNGQRCGCDFHRQKPVDEYILDFFCRELLLAVEIDGGSHRLKGRDDESRQRRLEALGIRFLRFKEAEVGRNLDGVVRAIDNWIATHSP